MLSDHGPVEGAQMADWPIGYDDLAPYYDIVEQRVGVQGDRRRIPARTLEQSPAGRQFVMPPNPTGYAAKLLAEGASRMGFEALPYPAAVNSEAYDGRRACNSCGMCSGFGCPINARGDALVSWLNPALRTGRVRVRLPGVRAPHRDDRRRPPGPSRALDRRDRAKAPAAGLDGRGRRQPDQHRPAAAPLPQ